MNRNAFLDLWAQVMFLSSQNCKSQGRVWFENIKTSQVSINQEMQEEVYAIFRLLYSQQSYYSIKYSQYFIELFVLVLFNFLVDFQFCCPTCKTFNQVCVALIYSYLGFRI